MAGNHIMDLIKGYGWAVLAIAIALYAIIAFVTGTSKGFVETDCKISTGFVCASNPTANQFNKTLAFLLTNNKEYPIQLINTQSISCIGASAISENTAMWDIGETKQIAISPCNFISGQRYEESLIINYVNLLKNKNETLLANIIVRAGK